MFWADRIAGEIEKRFAAEIKSGKPLVIRDEKTTSGWAHVGSMRSAAMHGVISEALDDKGIPNTYYFEFNDFDAMDGIPAYLSQETYRPYLGTPLRDIPAPDHKAKSLAEYFANDFQSVITESGFKATFYFSSELYLSGKMDGVIEEALVGADTIRAIYREVSGSQREDVWLPIMVKCPQCGKISTTQASDFDGQTVAFVCSPTKVEWAKGCEHSGRISPFRGNAKLPWKVEWAAKWKVMQVQIEGAGKDHSTKGGSRDVASAICRQVFCYEPPFDSPHEFFLVGGKKIASSTGLGSTARAIADLLPKKIFRLSLIGKDIMQAVNFDPEGDSIPVLYDQYDALAMHYWNQIKDDYARLFEFIHVEHHISSPLFLPRFSQVAFIVQMPHLNLEKEVERLKGGALTTEDTIELAERAKYAKRWLDTYAPEKFVFKLQENLPDAVKTLTAEQKNALAALLQVIQDTDGMPDGDSLHHAIHDIKDKQKIEPQQLFSAIYLTFLDKQFGPKAGWFLSVLNKEFVLKRLTEAAR
jgi:lysyl-tRNA synthetase class 1